LENHPLNRKINDKNALPKEEMRYEEFSHSIKEYAMEMHLPKEEMRYEKFKH
jgi:hypothetical protein